MKPPSNAVRDFFEATVAAVGGMIAVAALILAGVYVIGVASHFFAGQPHSVSTQESR